MFRIEVQQPDSWVPALSNLGGYGASTSLTPERESTFETYEVAIEKAADLVCARTDEMFRVVDTTTGNMVWGPLDSKRVAPFRTRRTHVEVTTTREGARRLCEAFERGELPKLVVGMDSSELTEYADFAAQIVEAQTEFVAGLEQLRPRDFAPADAVEMATAAAQEILLNMRMLARRLGG
jgi:hypothetical protein